MKNKKEIPIIVEVKIEPASNGFTIQVEDSKYNRSKFVCKDFEELINSLKTLNWGNVKKENTLNEAIAAGQ